MRPEKIEFPDEIPVKAFVRCVEHYPYHWHNALEIIRVLKGSVHIGLGDERLLLGENDIAAVNMGELHRISKSQEENEILFVQIDDRFCRSILPDHRYLFIYCCSAYHEGKAPEKYQKLKEQMARLVRAFHKREKLPRENEKDIGHILKDMLTYLTYQFDFLRWGFGTKLVGALAVLCLFDPVFALVFAGAGLAMFLSTKTFREKLKHLHKNMQEKDGLVRSFMQELLESLIVVKIFGAEREMKGKAAELQEEHYRQKLKKNKVGILANSADECFLPL